MYLALENEMQSTREQPEKGEDEDNMVIPREPRKWIVSRKSVRDGLRDGGIGDGTKLYKANHDSQEKRKDTDDESHLSKMLTASNENKLSRRCRERARTPERVI